MLRDIFYNFFHCTTPVCLIWNVAYLFGVYLLGLAMAYQIWVQPWRRHWTESSDEPYEKEPAATEGPVPENATEIAALTGGASETNEESEPEDDESLHVGEIAAEGAAGALGLATIGNGAEPDEEKDEPVSEPPADDLVNEQAEMSEKSFGTDDVRLDPLLGILYEDAPPDADDLTRIDSIEMDLEGDLNDLGVHRFHQIANWSPDNVENFSKRLHLGGRIEREDWVSQARRLVGRNGGSQEEPVDSGDEEDLEEAATEASGGPELIEDGYKAPVEVDREDAIATYFAGEPVRSDSHLGIIYVEKPEVPDDLTRIEEISSDREWELNRLGIYRFQQIGHWTDRNVAEISEKLRIFKDKIEREEWIPQAQKLYRETYQASQIWKDPQPALEKYEARLEENYQGEPAHADGVLGILYDSRPEDADDLSEIEGISDLMAQWLEDSGVFRFQQIADWSEANVSGFAERLDLPAGRIYRERWIPQAQELAAKARFSELA